MQLDKKTVRTVLKILCGTILFAWCLVNHEAFFSFLRFITGLATPFLLGLTIAFVLNVPMRALETRLFSRTPLGKKKGLCRIVSLVCTLALFVLLAAGVFWVVVPELRDTAALIVEGLPSLFARLEVWGEQLSAVFPSLKEEISSLTGASGYVKLVELLSQLLSSGFAGNLLGSTVTLATGVVSSVTNFFIGMIFAFYVLSQKEKLGVQVRKVLYAWCGTSCSDHLLYVSAMSNRIFSNFISGQCLEAVILGSMFFVSMSILRFPYAMLVAVLISVMALIPIFGAFIGCVVGTFLILVQNPMQALWFLVLFFVLQQIEGNFIYPRVVGSSIGLPPMWVLLSVTVGASLGGIAGMLLMVPAASVAYALLRENTNRRLAEQAIPADKYKNPPKP